MITRETLLSMLGRFARQRPGLEFGNYGDVAAYRAEMRSIGKDLSDARVLLSAVESSSMPVETLLDQLHHRLTLIERPDGRFELDYCVGQYWCTEYRPAVCRALADALWCYHRDDYVATRRGHESEGDAVRREFRRRFGRGMARRWFS